MRKRCLTYLGRIGILGGVLAIDGPAGAAATSPAANPGPNLPPKKWPSMLNYQSVWTPAEQNYELPTPPAGCEAPLTVKIEDKKVTCIDNPAWGAQTATCSSFYQAQCNDAKAFNEQVEAAITSRRVATDQVYPILLDPEGEAERGNSLETAFRLPYRLVGTTKPGVGMTVFDTVNQNNTFATSTLANTVRVLGAADSSTLQGIAGGQSFDPSWLTHGAEVRSCSEYVYKRFYGYRRYVDAAAAMGDDWNRAFLAAYTTPGSSPSDPSGNVGISQWDQVKSYFPSNTPVTDVQKQRIPHTMDGLLSSLSRNAYFRVPKGVYDILLKRDQGDPTAIEVVAAVANNAQRGPLWTQPLYQPNGQLAPGARDEFAAHRAMYDEMRLRYPTLTRAEIEDNEARVRSFVELVSLDEVLSRKLACLQDPLASDCKLDVDRLVRGLTEREVRLRDPLDPVPPTAALDPWERYQDLDIFEANLSSAQSASRIDGIGRVKNAVPSASSRTIAKLDTARGSWTSTARGGITGTTALLTSISTAVRPMSLSSSQLSSMTATQVSGAPPELVAGLVKLSARDAELLDTEVLKTMPLSTLSLWAQQSPSISARVSTFVIARKRQITLLEQQIDELEKKMADALTEEHNRGENGCLFVPPTDVKVCPKTGPCSWVDRPYNPNRCDWSDKSAVRRFTSMLERSEEAEFNRCAKYTNNDLDSSTGWQGKVVFDASMQKRKFYPSYERGPAYRNETIDNVRKMSYKAENGTYVPSGTMAETGWLSFWNSDALRLDAFIERLEKSAEWRAAEHEALVKAIEKTVKAGQDGMKGLPMFKTAVIKIDGQPENDVVKAKGKYATDKVMSIGTAKSDGAAYGDPSWFSAGWKYDWGWEVKPRLREAKRVGNAFDTAESLAPWRRIGGVEGSLHVLADAQARGMFDLLAVNALHAQITGVVDSTSQVSTAQFTVLDKTIDTSYSETRTGLSFNLVHDYSKTYSTDQVSVTFPVWCVAMRFSASASLDVGLQYVLEGATPSLKVDQSGTANADFAMKGYVEPYAKVTAVGGGAVSAGIAEGGAQITVDLVRLGVPAGVSVSSTKTGSDAVGGGYQFQYEEGAKVAINTLRGQVDAYLEVGVSPFSKSFSARLFGWNGLSQEVPVVANRNQSFGIDSWAWQIFGSPLQDPATKQQIMLFLMNDLESTQ